MEPILEAGEKIHVVERRMFLDDVRRHFVGEVKRVTESAIRITGYVWVYNHREAKFVRRREKRDRLLVLGDRLIINVLPRDVVVEEVVYNTDDVRRMFVTDNRGFVLELSEFVDLK
jgi:hypothetical protein